MKTAQELRVGNVVMVDNNPMVSLKANTAKADAALPQLSSK